MEPALGGGQGCTSCAVSVLQLEALGAGSRGGSTQAPGGSKIFSCWGIEKESHVLFLFDREASGGTELLSLVDKSLTLSGLPLISTSLGLEC